MLVEKDPAMAVSDCKVPSTCWLVGWLGIMDRVDSHVMTVQWTFISSIEHPFKPSTPVASLKGHL